MNDIDERIRAALTARATQVDERDLRPGVVAAGSERNRTRWLPPLLAAAVVAAIAITAGVVVASQDASAPSRIRPGAGVTPTSTATTAPPPISTTVAADRAPVSTGHSPWHADPAATALAFATGYLQYSDITTVTSRSVLGDQAHIGVGYRLPTGGMHTAAVLHLVRYAATVGDTAAAWEVVGSDDTTFSLERPAYGSAVGGVLTVGGHVTGVDENIVVAVRNQAGAVVSGAVPGIPAGGTHTPWQQQVPVSASGVLTVVAFTGGHLSQHEQFAIQGVHT